LGCFGSPKYRIFCEANSGFIAFNPNLIKTIVCPAALSVQHLRFWQSIWPEDAITSMELTPAVSMLLTAARMATQTWVRSGMAGLVRPLQAGQAIPVTLPPAARRSPHAEAAKQTKPLGIRVLSFLTRTCLVFFVTCTFSFSRE
jgi:hypothetical protein